MFPMVCHKSAVQWYQKFRDLTKKALEAERALWDNCVVVQFDASDLWEIDESHFGKKAKYGKGRVYTQTWVFGMILKGTKEVILRTVPNRTKDTLIPIIKEYARPQSTIYSDDWASYKCLEEEGFRHGVVVHKEEFKSKEGVCTNSIEGGYYTNKFEMFKN